MSSVITGKARGPELSVEDLCKFVRTHFGNDAAEVAQQHVAAYRGCALHDVAATWASVRDQLRKEDQATNRI